jgi:hypothetical protein
MWGAVESHNFLILLLANEESLHLLHSSLWKIRTFDTMAAVKKLRAWLAEKDNIVVCPGVYDGLTARIALSAGFECLYMVIFVLYIFILRQSLNAELSKYVMPELTCGRQEQEPRCQD